MRHILGSVRVACRARYEILARRSSRPGTPIAPRERHACALDRHGTLTFGLVAIPVKIYATSEHSHEVHFHLVHEGCGERLHQQYICPRHGSVDRDQIIKGYELRRGNFVELSRDELKALEAVASDEITIEEFVPGAAVDPLLVATRRSVPASHASRAPRRPAARPRRRAIAPWGARAPSVRGPAPRRDDRGHAGHRPTPRSCAVVSVSLQDRRDLRVAGASRVRRGTHRQRVAVVDPGVARSAGAAG